MLRIEYQIGFIQNLTFKIKTLYYEITRYKT